MSVFALVERLAPIIKSEVDLVINCKQEAASLSSKLSRIQVGLQEAERIGVTDKGVRDWLKELEDVTYEVDDVLDELESANLQVEVQDTSFDWEKVRTLLDSLCSCFKQTVGRREITAKMKALSVRIDTILTKKGEYTFVSSDNDGTQDFKQEDSTSLVSKTYGLEDVKNSLVEKLVLEGENSDKDTQIISIVGVGGVGKSTLARVAFNDPEVDAFFAPKGWVSVSQAFNALDIAKAILESFGGKSDEAHNLETLVQRIKNAVNNKRFLLVFDNVWTEDRKMWESLKNCLDGGKGSRIVITTRLESVARIMGTTKWQPLGLLSDKDCGTILNGVALEGRPKEECEKLRGIGRELAMKCKGLPLAAKSMGSMLALGTFTIQEWRDVLESPLWTNGEEDTEVFRILNLSYTHLSPLLKRCFLSSVIFPKGTKISMDEINVLWMAYGWMNSKRSINEVQLKGLQLTNNLVMRSFFQRTERGEGENAVVAYEMHDIIHDFACYLSRGDGYSFIKDCEFQKELPWDSLGRLRTFSVCNEKLRPDIVSHLTSVRVLSMSDCNLEGLPRDIGNLIHLRYLNVSRNPITQLPDTITDLCNLQTLDIGRCNELTSLPEGIGKLINLRHLLNTNTYSIRMCGFPQGLEKLSGLWTLSEFRGRNLGCLKNLNQLQGFLLLDLENLNEREVGDPELWKKQHIKKLVLLLRTDEEVDEVVEVLKLPPNLESFEIYSGWGKWLSRWFNTSSFDHLKTITLYGRGRHGNVPPFGKLPALEELQVCSCRFRRLSIEFLGLDQDASSSSSLSGQVVGGFPRLKKLSITGCGKWEEWEDIAEGSVPVMTSLEELQIGMCFKLKALPHNLLGQASSLRVVEIYSSPILYKRYNNRSRYGPSIIPPFPNQIWTVKL